MHKAVLNSLGFAILTVFLSTSVSAQSFNCNYAKAVDEVAICRSPLLSRLDEQMSTMYHLRQDHLSGPLFGVQRLQLENGQAAWLSGRRLCGGDPGCIEQAYRQRIRELSSD
jgi:uncharacterized protein